MKKFNLFAVLALVTVFAFTSCKDKSATDANAALTTDSTGVAATPADPMMDPAAAGAANAAVDGAQQAAAAPVPTGPLTTIKFEEETYDWGKVMDGEKMTHVFKFKNTGKEPLIISNAKGSCGCTVPEWPKDAIAPGKSGEIKVVFDSKGKGAVGGKDDSKRVTITANTDPAETFLTIKGKIDAKADAAAPKK
ncbi:MAG: DUF1573 domain-containing protein [Saprospiraceae bacterium]|nr:DUF1573 domain-containing protein [Saprospiraceae bacterium]